MQIEIVGFATKSPNFDQKYLDGIKSLLRWIETVNGVPRRAASFLAYPASAGDSAVRFSSNQWLAFSGTCGHQHVVDNDHGDPGNININYLMSGDGKVWEAPGETDSTHSHPTIEKTKSITEKDRIWQSYTHCRFHEYACADLYSSSRMNCVCSFHPSISFLCSTVGQ